MKSLPLHGILPATPTAMLRGAIDFTSMERHYHFLSEAKVQGVVVAGSTGEAATLNEKEYRQLIEFSRTQLKLPLIVGVGSNATATTIQNSRIAAELGADALLVVTPYYNKPPQEGLYQHFKAVAAATQLPVILYNVPGRTGCNLLAETVERLAEIPNIVGIKEASASLAQGMEVYARVKRRRADFSLLSGEDLLYLPLLACGFDGVITVIGNVRPHEMVAMTKAFQKGDHPEAIRLHYALRELCEALFLETNPIPVKAALQELKIFTSRETRPPLCDVSEKLLGQLRGVLKSTARQVQP